MKKIAMIATFAAVVMVSGLALGASTLLLSNVLSMDNTVIDPSAKIDLSLTTSNNPPDGAVQWVSGEVYKEQIYSFGIDLHANEAVMEAYIHVVSCRNDAAIAAGDMSLYWFDGAIYHEIELISTTLGLEATFDMADGTGFSMFDDVTAHYDFYLVYHATGNFSTDWVVISA